MKKIIILLAIVAYIAIVTSLITNTCHRLATRRKKEVTPCLDDVDDEVWRAEELIIIALDVIVFTLKGTKKIQGDLAKENQ